MGETKEKAYRDRVKKYPQPTHEEIAVEAEVLWRQAGCPPNRDEVFWLEAERQLHQIARTYRNEQDEKAISDPLSRLDLKSDDVMGELTELFPSQPGNPPPPSQGS